MKATLKNEKEKNWCEIRVETKRNGRADRLITLDWRQQYLIHSWNNGSSVSEKLLLKSAIWRKREREKERQRERETELREWEEVREWGRERDWKRDGK